MILLVTEHQQTKVRKVVATVRTIREAIVLLADTYDWTVGYDIVMVLHDGTERNLGGHYRPEIEREYLGEDLPPGNFSF